MTSTNIKTLTLVAHITYHETEAIVTVPRGVPRSYPLLPKASPLRTPGRISLREKPGRTGKSVVARLTKINRHARNEGVCETSGTLECY